METVTKETKSIKNAEKRRERSKVAARCRRGKESEIFNDLSVSLPMPETVRAGLDKASIMRLTLCDLKIKNMMDTVFPVHVDHDGVLNEEYDSQANNAMGGFILVCTLDGDVIYASEGITSQLGICQYEIMGQSIFEFSHPCDHSDIRDMMVVRKGEGDDVLQRSGLFRMKNTVTARGRNAHLRSGTFKVINCIGRIFTGCENDTTEKWFVSVCEPLPHPSDVDIPLNKQTFLSKHTPDMKFEYVDDSISNCMGYQPAEMLGKSIFDFHHASDGDGLARSFKTLYSKGQNQTERYRFLTKGGGWVWLVTQATVIYGGGNSSTPNSVVCIHFITSGIEEKDVILSEVQMTNEVVKEETPNPVLVPVSKSVLSESNTNIILDSNTTSKDPDGMTRCPIEETDMIVDILSGPLLNHATCTTSKIFTPKTVDMESDFLMPNEDILIVSKEEPDDLTHLAPIAGDDCVSLDIPLLEDLLASLNEADMEYSLIDPESDEIPQYDMSGFCFPPYEGGKQETSMGIDNSVSISQFPVMTRSDPTMIDASISKSPSPSLYQEASSDSPLSGGFLSTSELGCSPMNNELFSEHFEDVDNACSNIDARDQSFDILTTFVSTPAMPLKSIAIGNSNGGSQTTLPKVIDLPHSFWDSNKRKYFKDDQDWSMAEEEEPKMGTSDTEMTGPTPNKVTKIVPLCSAGLIRAIQKNGVPESDSLTPRVFILVPVNKRRASLSSNHSSSSGSDTEYTSSRRSSFEKIQENYDNKDFNSILSSFGFEFNKSSASSHLIDSSKPHVDISSKRIRKRNFAGNLLNDGPLSLHELTRQDCEVNAPLRTTAELLQGNELLTALDV